METIFPAVFCQPGTRRSRDPPIRRHARGFDASLCFQAEDRFNQARTQYAQATVQNTMGSQDDNQMANPFSLPVETTTGSNASWFWLIGETEEDMRYGMVARVIAPGGTLTTSDGVLSDG